MTNWMHNNTVEASWTLEYNIRKELGGFFPEEYDKQFYFSQLFLAINKKKQNDTAMNKLRRLMRGKS